MYDQLPMPGFQSLTAIDMDVRNGNIFFSDTSLKKIFRASYNGTNLTEVIVKAMCMFAVNLTPNECTRNKKLSIS